MVLLQLHKHSWSKSLDVCHIQFDYTSSTFIKNLCQKSENFIWQKVEIETIQLTFSQASLQHVLRKKYKQEV